MSDILELQRSLAEYKEDLVTAKVLGELKLTPAWKKIIDEGFVSGLTNKLVSELASASAEEKIQHLAVLTGISAFSGYLNDVITKGELAETGIEDTELALATLLGAE